MVDPKVIEDSLPTTIARFICLIKADPQPCVDFMFEHVPAPAAHLKRCQNEASTFAKESMFKGRTLDERSSFHDTPMLFPEEGGEISMKKERRPEYEVPQVISYTDDEILEELGEAQACYHVDPCGSFFRWWR